MQRLLSHHGSAALTRLAQSHALLSFDLDGTLAPLVDRPWKQECRRRPQYALRDCLFAGRLP